MALGVPTNVASYALLTHMIAQVTGLEASQLIHTVNSAHIYLPHVEGVEELVKRTPKIFPKIKFARDVKHIDDFKYEDFIDEEIKKMQDLMGSDEDDDENEDDDNGFPPKDE